MKAQDCYLPCSTQGVATRTKLPATMQDYALSNKQRCCQERGCIISLVKRHPLITFFVSTYVLTWAIESPFVFLTDSVTNTQGLVLSILSVNVPSVMAIVLTAMVFGRGSLRKLLGRLLIWRVNPFWYLVVILGPAALAGGVVGLNALLGGPALSLGMPLLGVAFFLAFSIFPGSALGEEIGWRGYALPRLQATRSALSASLILAPIWGLWHLPLWLTGDPVKTPIFYVPFFFSAFAFSVILTWVYNSTGGSLLMVVLLATHESLLYDKRDSQVTSAAIEQVVDAARTDRSLTR